jgi:uncharacterized membrane protein
MPITAHPFDIYVWYNLSDGILANGPLHPAGFPPLWCHYLLVPVAYLYDWLSAVLPTGTIAMSSLPSALDFYPSYQIGVVPGLLFNFIVKIPFLVSDILIAILLYKLVTELTRNKRLAQSAAALWFLNPFVIWISAGWGMWDTLPALFSVLALFLLVRKRFGLSALCLSFGVAAKLYPALFLVPLAFYLYKTVGVGERRRAFGWFLGVFSGATLLLFLPYLGAVANSIADFLMLGGDGAVGAITPLGPYSFGLTYWSLTGLLNLPATDALVTVISAVSLALVCASLVVVYWRSSKLTFKPPLTSLAIVALFCLAAVFLSYRIIPEQWVVWAVPFLVILCVAGYIRRGVFWGLSTFALVYAVLNCPLPFFFLPLSPWLSDSLVGMVQFVWLIDFLRAEVLVLVAIGFSLLLGLSAWRLHKQKL